MPRALRLRALASSAVSELWPVPPSLSSGQLRHLRTPGQLHHLRAPGQFGAVSEPFQAPLVLASSAVSGPRQLRRLRTLSSSAARIRALSSPVTSASPGQFRRLRVTDSFAVSEIPLFPLLSPCSYVTAVNSSFLTEASSWCGFPLCHWFARSGHVPLYDPLSLPLFHKLQYIQPSEPLPLPSNTPYCHLCSQKSVKTTPPASYSPPSSALLTLPPIPPGRLSSLRRRRQRP